MIKELLRFNSNLNNMSFIVRTSLLIVAVIPLLIYIYMNSHLITGNFNNLEKAAVKQKIQQGISVFRAEEKSLLKLATDYGIWDEAYYKIQEKDVPWFRENVTNWLPDSQGIDFVLIANTKKEVVDKVGLETELQQVIVNEPFIDKLMVKDYTNPQIYPSGMKLYGGHLYLLAASPILRSYYQGVPKGVIIIGKRVTGDLLSHIKRDYGNNLFIYYNNRYISSDEDSLAAAQRMNQINNNKKEIEVIPIGNSIIIGGLPLRDVSGNYLGKIFTVESRQLFVSTLSIARRNGYAVLALSVMVILVLCIWLKRIIVSPIKTLEEQISKMAFNSYLGLVTVKGPQEIVSLAEAFNKMSSSLLAQRNENFDLRALSITDDLTGLYNHRYFYDCLKEKTSDGKRKLTLLFADIDYFKALNDVHGHVAGDQILQEIGLILRSVLGDNGMVFRYGGEEFAVLLENVSPQQAFEIAEKIRLSVLSSTAIQKYSGYFPVSLSIGISYFPADALNAENLVSKADSAMYFAKKSGRNQCKIYAPYMEGLMGHESSGEQEMLIDSTYSLAAAIDAKDSYTEKHSEMVTRFSMLLAEKINLPDKDKYMLRIGALLHDVGKIGVPDDIIHKNGPLTLGDWGVVRNHTILGSNIARHIIKAPEIDACIRYHHERWDGGGYPDGLKGEEIPFFARIICIADSYHAMVSDRPYRQSLNQEKAFMELRQNAGTQFDPGLVEDFIEAISEVYSENISEVETSGL